MIEVNKVQHHSSELYDILGKHLVTASDWIVPTTTNKSLTILSKQLVTWIRQWERCQTCWDTYRITVPGARMTRIQDYIPWCAHDTDTGLHSLVRAWHEYRITVPGARMTRIQDYSPWCAHDTNTGLHSLVRAWHEYRITVREPWLVCQVEQWRRCRGYKMTNLMKGSLQRLWNDKWLFICYCLLASP